MIEATSGKGTEHLNIAVDDVWIGECERGRNTTSAQPNTAVPA